MSRWRRARAGADDPTGVGRGVRPEVSSVTTQRGCVPDQPLGNPDCAFPDRADGPLTALSAPDHVGERSFSTSFKGGSLRSPPSAGCGRSLRSRPRRRPRPRRARLGASGVLRLRRRLTGPRALGQLGVVDVAQPGAAALSPPRSRSPRSSQICIEESEPGAGRHVAGWPAALGPRTPVSGASVIHDRECTDDGLARPALASDRAAPGPS